MNKKLLTLLTLLFALTVHAEKAYTFRYNFQKGQKYLYKNIIEMSIDQTIQGRSVKTNSNMQFDLLFEVADVDVDKNYKIDMTYKRVVSKSTSAVGTVSYDSDKKDGNNPQLAQSMAPLVNHSFSMIMGPNGRVYKLTGMKALVEKLISGFKNNIPPQQLALVRQQMEKSFGDNAIKIMMEKSFKFLPTKPLKIGESFSSTENINFMYDMKLQNTTTLKEISKDNVVMTLDGKISTTDSSSLEMGQMKMVPKFSGTQKGSMTLDSKTSMVMHMEMLQNITGDITIQKQTIPMVIQSKVTIETEEIL